MLSTPQATGFHTVSATEFTVFFPERASVSLAALLILPVTASGSQILTVLEQDVLVAGPFLPRRHLTKETICFNEAGSHSETPFFFCVRGRKS